VNIPFLDVGATYQELAADIDAALKRVADSGWYILGPEVEAFEKEFAAYVGARHCVAVANGLDALHLALRALDIGPGDEVIVPSNTYIASWLAVSQCGARPVPVEPDESTFNLDPARIRAALTSRTKAIMPVHLYGLPADLDPIISLAREQGLSVIEDAAQAHGAKYKGQRIGAHGDVVAWSFYPGKNLGALGDAGAITTNNPEIAERMGLLRNYGSREKYYNEIQGYNSRLDPLHAAVLQVKLQHLESWNERRRAVVARYAALSSVASLRLPVEPEYASSAWHLYVVRHPRRAALQKALQEAGVGTLIHYPVPPHLQKAYAEMGLAAGALPISEAMHRDVLSLPMGPHLSPEAADRVVSLVASLA
jgi:dTDP-4-amino-4,6-dideoxygalactose transaminase